MKRNKSWFTKETNNIIDGKTIKPKDLPKDIIDASYKKKILDEKRFCKRRIINDAITSIGVFGMLSVFISALLRAEEVDGNAVTFALMFIIFAITIVVVGRILISIPKRIYNYIAFNFERTCYATVVNKYMRTTENNGRHNTYYIADLKIKDGLYIKDVSIIGSNKYFTLRSGENVIVTSFDGYSAYVIRLNGCK